MENIQTINQFNKRENVQAAQSVDMRAIHFKNSHQLRTALQNLGILLSPLETEKYVKLTNNSTIIKQENTN